MGVCRRRSVSNSATVARFMHTMRRAGHGASHSGYLGSSRHLTVSIGGLIVFNGCLGGRTAARRKDAFMKLAVILGTSLALASPAWAQSDRSKNTETHNTRPEPPMMGKHLAKGQARPEAGRRVSPNLTYHNGPVLTQTPGARVIPIMWGARWP